VAVVLALIFLAISLGIARWLTAENRERDDVYALLEFQARGDARGMLVALTGCAEDRRCRAQVERNARRLKRDGVVKILAYDSSTAYALGSATGPTRVAWGAGRALPVVQCVMVERQGNALGGRRVLLRRVSAPIDPQGSC
jgi:hypothetical protein